MEGEGDRGNKGIQILGICVAEERGSRSIGTGLKGRQQG